GRASPTSGSAPCSPPSMTLRAGCAGGLRPSLTAAPRGAGGIAVGTKKRPAVKQRNRCELDFDAAIRERMITSFAMRDRDPLPETDRPLCGHSLKPPEGRQMRTFKRDRIIDPSRAIRAWRKAPFKRYRLG